MKVLERDSGVTLVETMIAVLVALIGVFGLGSLIFQATVTNKNQGTEVTRATIYAQDKMEKLLSLDFASCTQGVSTNPNTCDSANITGTGWNTGLVAGGVLAPMQTRCPTSGSNPTLGYVDFLDVNGNQLPGATPGPCSALTTPIAYVRMWQISDVASGPPAMKQITVAVWSQAAVNTTAGVSPKPVVLLTSLISNPN